MSLVGEVEVPLAALGNVLRGLHVKRVELIRIQSKINEAPRGVVDLLAHCRSFVSTLTKIFEEGSDLSEKIKVKLLDDPESFQNKISELPFKGLFEDIERVKDELRVADGYQSYIVAPEDGLHNLFARAVEMMIPPVSDLVDAVFATLVEGVEQALRSGCEVPGLAEGSAPLIRFPHYLENILPVALEAVGSLREDTRKIALSMVEMEGSFMSCSFFRYLTFKRLRETYDTLERVESSEDMTKRLKRASLAVPRDDDEDEEFDNQSVASAETTQSLTPPQSMVFSNPDSVFLLSGYLEKSSSHSRNKAIKAESSLWQKRFFGIIEESRIMEYYNNEESFLKGGKAKGVVDLSVCVVEETDGDDLPMSTVAKSVDHIDRRNAVSLLIKIRSKNSKDFLFKNNQDIILRAPDASEKYKWFSTLKAVCHDTRNGAALGAWSSKKDLPNKNPGKPSSARLDDGKDTLREPMTVGHGLGSSLFWSDVCRDEHGILLPSPGIYLEGDLDLSMEKALKQHTRDMHSYTKLVCQTLGLTIPKVIVHCLVQRASAQLGPAIEDYLVNLSDDMRSYLLDEDPGLAIHRENIRKAMSDLADAEEKIKSAQRGQGGGSPGDDTSVRLPLQMFHVAGLMKEVSKERNSAGVYKYATKPPQGRANSSRPAEIPRSLPQNGEPPRGTPPVVDQPKAPLSPGEQRPASRSTVPKQPASVPQRAPPPPPGKAPRPQAPMNQQKQQGKGFFTFRPFEKQ